MYYISLYTTILPYIVCTDERVCALQRDKRLLYTYYCFIHVYRPRLRVHVFSFLHVRRLFDFVNERARVSADFRLVTIFFFFNAFLSNIYIGILYFFIHRNIIFMEATILYTIINCQRLHSLIRCTLQ